MGRDRRGMRVSPVLAGVEERWIALALYLEEEGLGCELSVVVTEIDPP